MYSWVPSEWAWRYGGCFYLSRKTARTSPVPLRIPCIGYDGEDDRLVWEENSQSSEGKLLWKVRSLRITFVAAKSSDTVCVGAATTIGLHASKLRTILCTTAGVCISVCALLCVYMFDCFCVCECRCGCGVWTVLSCCGLRPRASVCRAQKRCHPVCALCTSATVEEQLYRKLTKLHSFRRI